MKKFLKRIITHLSIAAICLPVINLFCMESKLGSSGEMIKIDSFESLEKFKNKFVAFQESIDPCADETYTFKLADSARYGYLEAWESKSLSKMNEKVIAYKLIRLIKKAASPKITDRYFFLKSTISYSKNGLEMRVANISEIEQISKARQNKLAKFDNETGWEDCFDYL